MTVFQQDLFGGETVAGNIVDKMTHILETYPEAQANYKMAIYKYWLEFDDLDDLLRGMCGFDGLALFRDWFINNATSPKTLQNRAMEIQNARPDLEAPSEVEEWRQRQARAGRVT